MDVSSYLRIFFAFVLVVRCVESTDECNRNTCCCPAPMGSASIQYDASGSRTLASTFDLKVDSNISCGAKSKSGMVSFACQITVHAKTAVCEEKSAKIQTFTATKKNNTITVTMPSCSFELYCQKNMECVEEEVWRGQYDALPPWPYTDADFPKCDPIECCCPDKSNNFYVSRRFDGQEGYRFAYVPSPNAQCGKHNNVFEKCNYGVDDSQCFVVNDNWHATKYSNNYFTWKNDENCQCNAGLKCISPSCRGVAWEGTYQVMSAAQTTSVFSAYYAIVSFLLLLMQLS